MKIPKAKKLPSGNWNVVVMVNGNRISLTAPTKRQAEQEAAAIKSRAKAAEKKTRLTVGEAIDRYISSKDAVLSPATVAGYRRIRAHALQDIMDLELDALTQERVQRSVNAMSRDKSPKSVRNAHGLLSATLSVYRPGLVLRTTLPQKKKADISIPEPEILPDIMRAVHGAAVELPVMLALWLGLRASEIRGITWDSIVNGVLHVKQAIVQGENGPVVKTTKTTAGDRWLTLPPVILALIEDQPKVDDYVVHMSAQAMNKAFSRACAAAGLPHFRFHDLRHANASVMLALGVPDKYSRERMGHATDHMLQTVYQHTMAAKRQEVDATVNRYFESIIPSELQTKLQTEKAEP